MGKNHTAKKLMYLCIGAFVLFFCPPLIKWGISCFSENDYEKALLLIPTNIVIAYAAIAVFEDLKEKKQRKIWICFCCILLLLSGHYAYSEIYAAGLIENSLYVNNEYADVCSRIPLENGNLILPCDEMIGRTLRRIDGRYQLLYGQDIETCTYSSTIKKIHDDLEMDVIPIEEVVSLAETEGVTHIVLYKWSKYETAIEELIESGKIQMWADADNYWVFNVCSNK